MRRRSGIPLIGIGIVVALLATMGGQCTSGTTTGSTAAPTVEQIVTSAPTAIVTLAPEVGTLSPTADAEQTAPVSADAARLQAAMDEVSAVVDQVAANVQNLTPEQQQALADQMSVLMDQIGAFMVEFEPVINAMTPEEQSEAIAVLYAMYGTVQQIIGVVGQGTPFSTAEAVATGSNDAMGNQIDALIQEIRGRVKDLDPAEMNTLAALVNDLTRQTNQLVAVLRPAFMRVSSSEQTDIINAAEAMIPTVSNMLSIVLPGTPAVQLTP